jgi:hypothetical protein
MVKDNINDSILYEDDWNKWFFLFLFAKYNIFFKKKII